MRSREAVGQPAVESLWQQPSQERVNNYKGEVGEAFLKVTWSVPGRGGGGERRTIEQLNETNSA